MVNFLKKLLGDPNRRIISKYQRVVVEINELEPEFKSLSDEALRQLTEEFRERLADGETLDDLLLSPPCARPVGARLGYDITMCSLSEG